MNQYLQVHSPSRPMMPQIVTDLLRPPVITCCSEREPNDLNDLDLISLHVVVGAVAKAKVNACRFLAETGGARGASYGLSRFRASSAFLAGAVARRDVDLIDLVPIAVGFTEDRAMPALLCDARDEKLKLLRMTAK